MKTYAKQPMKKEISALNTFWFIDYINEHYTEVDFDHVIDQMNEAQGHPYYIENLATGKTEKVSVAHLKNSHYWLSNDFVMFFYEKLQKRIPDPALAYKVGKTVYRSQPLLKTAIGIPLMGPYRLLKRGPKEVKKFNRTKEMVIDTLEKGHVVFRLIQNKNTYLNAFTMNCDR
ncbi:MAG: hypothetical protein SWH68_08030 [Thermodesulfobacteriota bacterium]|nr:hypothetical protein [Thermodesulfobacteriota bacterium]